MKHLLLTLCLALAISYGFPQVGINTDESSPDPSAMLDVKSTSAGLLVPRMNSDERDAIISPAEGLLVYCTDDSSFYYHHNARWNKLIPGNPLIYSGSLWMRETIHPDTGVIYKGNETFLHDYRGGNSQGRNTFLGIGSGNLALPGIAYPYSSNNTGLGHMTLHPLTDGRENTAVGSQSMSQTTTGYQNTAIGSGSMEGNTTGYFNTVVGAGALQANSTGVGNTAIGSFALLNTTGSYNLGIGGMAAQNTSTGVHNTAIGYRALYYNQTGSYNVILGHGAGQGISGNSMSRNVILGYGAGGQANGDYNVFIGHMAGYSETGSNKLHIDNSNTMTPLIGGDFYHDELYLRGQVGIGHDDLHSTAILDIGGSTGGVLLPRLSSSERISIATPARGLLMYDSTLNRLVCYTGSQWNLVHVVEEGSSLGSYYFSDADGDGYGNPYAQLFVPSGDTPPANYTADNTDCDDADISVYPGAIEICDGKDNDCNPGTADGSGEAPTITCLVEGVCLGTTPVCAGADGWICYYPGEYEDVEVSCDGMGNDCDGITDDVVNPNLFKDFDSDGYGSTIYACLCAPQYPFIVLVSGDCDDSNANRNPGLAEVCNDIDDDCDGILNEGFTDWDGDKLPDCIDTDDDNDGVTDVADNCPINYNPGQADTDGDGIGDACDYD